MPNLYRRRPAEVKTAGLGTAGALVQALAGMPWWAWTITLVTAYAPGVITWVDVNGGIVGAWDRLLHGRPQHPSE